MATTHSAAEYISQFQNPVNMLDTLESYLAQSGQVTAGWNETASVMKALGVLPPELQNIPKTSDYGYNNRFNQWYKSIKSDPSKAQTVLAQAGYGTPQAVQNFAQQYYSFKSGLPSNYGSLPNPGTVPTATSTPAPTAAPKQPIDYTFHAGQETIDQYNARIAAANSNLPAPGTTSSTGIAGLGAPSTPAGPATPGSPTQATAAHAQTDAQFQALLNDPKLTADQKALLGSLYSAVSTNDTAYADKIKAGIAAGTQFSDPYFKAQTRIALDALDRGLGSQEGDLTFQKTQLQNSLKDLQDNVAASKDKLSFDQQQELQKLSTQYEQGLQDTEDEMAATGFTDSSKRSKAEGYLKSAYGGAVESSNRQLAYQLGTNDRQLAGATRDNALQIANLQRLTQEGKLDLYRKTEQQTGSGALPSFSGLSPLGGVGGAIPQAQAQDALSFANNFIF